MKRSVIGLAIVAALVGWSCASKQKQSSQRPTALDQEAKKSRSGKAGTVQLASSTPLRIPPIFFDYDSDLLQPRATEQLARLGAHLRKQPALRLTIEGHCDERGTLEYNLALGDRRARAVQRYLLRMGAAAQQLEVLSWGKQKPAALGDGEAVWSQNRRAEFNPRQR